MPCPRPDAAASAGPSALECDRHVDRARGRAERLASGGEGVGPRPRGSARHLPQHADDARRRGARAHPLPAGEDPRLVLHGPRQRGRRRSRSRPRWAATTSARRSTATWASTSRAASSRGGSSPTTWAASTGPRRAATATSTWPTTTSGSSRWSRTCRRCSRSRSAARSPSGSARRSASRSAGSARAPSARGDTHEAMNFAGVRQLPVVFICDNNQWAYSTPTHLEYAVEHLADRAAGLRLRGRRRRRHRRARRLPRGEARDREGARRAAARR